MLDRRALLAGAATTLLGCSRRAAPLAETDAPPTAADSVDVRDWSFPGAAATGGAERVAVIVPRAPSGTRFPALIALHGRGEAVRGPEVGAYGWLRDYHLLETWRALADGRVDDTSLQGFIDPDRAARQRASLGARPFAGLVVICPHTPDVLTGSRALDAADRFGAFVESVLLPRVRAECPVTDSIGIDGVSLGGRVSLLVGLPRPALFAAVGTLQPAIRAEEAEPLVALAKTYQAGRPAGALRLLTSDADPFRPAVLALHEGLDAAHVAHEHVVVVGPHNYAFNRGPGGIEMLLWHDRVLRGQKGL